MRDIMLVAILFVIAIFVTGCFQGEQTSEEIDPPPQSEAVEGQNVNGTDESDQGEQQSKESNQAGSQTETVARQLYLIDSNGMVAPQTLDIPLPESKEVAAQALEYLVMDGPVSALLPNGFRAVLPPGTEILGLNLQEDGTMIVDVSEDFKEYNGESELQILQAMTYTLTEFDGVDRVQLWIEGEEQEEMPVNGTPILDGYSRANGINIMPLAAGDIMNQEAVTVYFPAVHHETQYFVPVTQHVEGNQDNMFEAVVNAVLQGPNYESNLRHVFNMETALLNEPTLKDGVLQLEFNQAILKNREAGIISDDVMETLVRSLTEHQGVKSVDVKVDQIDQIVNENGDVYKEPVNKNMFVPKDKL